MALMHMVNAVTLFSLYKQHWPNVIDAIIHRSVVAQVVFSTLNGI
jgi:hypothetical protein